MKNILVGVNFSNQSAEALKYALRLAAHFSAQLTIAHILDFYEDKKVAELYGKDTEEHREVHDEFKQTKLELLKDFVNEFYHKQFHGVKINYVVKYGETNDELKAIAKDRNADMIVLGKFTQPGDLFHRNTPKNLINWLQLPLFIVPEHSKFEGFDRIIYATDFILEDLESIYFFMPWLKVFDAELVCLHVCPTEDEVPAAKRKLELLRKLFPQENISFRNIVAPVKSGISRYVSLSKTDLLAVTHRKRNLWQEWFNPSLSKDLAERTKVPMMIFQQF